MLFQIGLEGRAGWGGGWGEGAAARCGCAPRVDKAGEASVHVPPGGKVTDQSSQIPLPAPPPHSLTPGSSPKAESYSRLFLKEAFEAMSQFFPFLSLGIVYFGRLLFSMSCECHYEAGLSWTASTRERGRSQAGPAVKNTSRFISPLKTKPWGPFATAEPGNGASQSRKLAVCYFLSVLDGFVGPRSNNTDLLCDLGQLA